MSFDLFVETLDFSLEKLLLLRRKQITEKRHQLLFFFFKETKKKNRELNCNPHCVCVCVCIIISLLILLLSNKKFRDAHKRQTQKKKQEKRVLIRFFLFLLAVVVFSSAEYQTERPLYCPHLISFVSFSSLSLCVCVGCPICSRLGSADCSLLLLLLEKQLDKEENSFVVLFSLSLLEWIDPQFSHHFLPAPPPSTPNQWTVCPARDFSFLQLCSSYDP